MDPLCLIHGVFFSDPGVARQPEGAPGDRSGHRSERRRTCGVWRLKRDDVQFTSAEGRGAEKGYGFVPFGRTEYTAAEIRLRAAVDLAQIRGYGLRPGDAAA